MVLFTLAAQPGSGSAAMCAAGEWEAGEAPRTADDLADSSCSCHMWRVAFCEGACAWHLSYAPAAESPLAVQVRQLQTLGFPIKRDILAEVDTAGRFYRHGLVLKQVANFYNDIATQIIPCQKPMLLAVSCHSVCVVFHCSCIMSAGDLSPPGACMHLV